MFSCRCAQISSKDVTTRRHKVIACGDDFPSAMDDATNVNIFVARNLLDKSGKNPKLNGDDEIIKLFKPSEQKSLSESDFENIVGDTPLAGSSSCLVW